MFTSHGRDMVEIIFPVLFLSTHTCTYIDDIILHAWTCSSSMCGHKGVRAEQRSEHTSFTSFFSSCANKVYKTQMRQKKLVDNATAASRCEHMTKHTCHDASSPKGFIFSFGKFRFLRSCRRPRLLHDCAAHAVV